MRFKAFAEGVGKELAGNWQATVAYLQENAAQIIWNLIIVAVIFFSAKLLMVLISAITSGVIKRNRKRPPSQQNKRTETLMTLLRSTLRYGIYIIAIFLALDVFGLSATTASILATAGIGGLAIGFGAQSLVKDVVTGLFLMFENQFSVGEFIKLENGTEGTVEATALRVTYLRTWKGDKIIVPNGAISKVTNISRSGYIAAVNFAMPYENDAQAVMHLLDAAVQHYADENADLLEERPSVIGITAFEESSATITVTARCKTMQHWAVERGLRMAIKQAVDAAGVEFGYRRVVVQQGVQGAIIPIAQTPQAEPEREVFTPIWQTKKADMPEKTND